MDEDSPTFDQVNLVVSDMAATVAFYRRLGLNIPETTPEWTSHHRSAEISGGIDLDFDSAEFAAVWDEGWTKHTPRPAVFDLAVPTRAAVDDLYRELTDDGYVGEHPPHDAFFGSRYAIVQDPDGNPVGIRSPSDPSMRSVQSPPG
jgi:catechol 2,3-dioxygenase-like lactoylglutathione lyase family enzyme